MLRAWLIVGVTALVGCTRRPVELDVEGLPSAAVGVAVGADPSAAPADDETIGALCERACQRWASTRFLEPIWPAGASSEARASTNALIEDQRRLNAETCVQACTASGNRTRARCLGDATNVSASRDCFRPPGATASRAPAPAARPARPAAAAPAVDGDEGAAPPPPARPPVYTPGDMDESDEAPIPS